MPQSRRHGKTDGANGSRDSSGSGSSEPVTAGRAIPPPAAMMQHFDEKGLRNLLDAARVGIGVLRHQRFCWFNQALADVTGYPAAELLGIDWRALLVPAAEWGGAGEEGPVLDADGAPHGARWLRKDGSEVEVLLSAAPLHDQGGAVSGDVALTVVAMNAAAYHSSGQDGAAICAELEQAFHAATPHCLLSPDCRIRKVNQAFCDFFDCRAEEILGASGGDLWGCEQCDPAACPLAAQPGNAVGRYREIDTMVHGRRLVCTLRAASYGDASGRVRGTIVTVVDDRERKRMATDLLHTRQQLIQAEKLSAVGSLAGSIAHEFNNPLCGIRGVVERMARKTELADAERGLLQLALEQCDRMKRLIRDLQQFNRPFSDARHQFDLHHAIDSALLLLNKHLKLCKATLRREYGPEPMRMVGVENQIKQVLLNLLKNGGESLPEGGGELTVRTERASGRVRVIVADTGCGIAAHHLPHLFEPFFTTKNPAKETGLGLAVSSAIVKAHGGEIQVESTPGRGTTCIVILPDGIEEGDEGGDGAT